MGLAQANQECWNCPGRYAVWIAYMGVTLYSFITEQSVENC